MNLLCFSSNQFKHPFFSEKLNQSIVTPDYSCCSVGDLNTYLGENLGLSSCNLIEINYTKFLKKIFDGNVYSLKNTGKFRIQYINDHFDYVVISLCDCFTNSNITSIEHLYTAQFFEFVEHLEIPIILVDCFIESKKFLSLNSLTVTKIIQLLLKAKAITTIDDNTKKYLMDFGIQEVECLGYLGFYLNHNNVYKSIGALKNIDNIDSLKVATSSICSLNDKCEISKLGLGFIKNLISKNSIKDLCIIFKDELFSFQPLYINGCKLYDEENNKFNDSFINKIKENNELDKELKLSIFLFLNLQVWYKTLSNYDVFVSNFFKASVIAMQSGIPAIFVDSLNRFMPYLKKFDFLSFQDVPIIKDVRITADKINNIQNKYLASYEYAKNYFKKILKPVSSKISVLQDSNFTASNRYPAIFSYFSDNHINDKKMVLSFGCSVGDEVFSLDQYFKNSIIIGVDISDEMIDIAKERAKIYRSKNNNQLYFYLTKDLDKNDIKGFDVIFVMSVLCKWWKGGEEDENTENIINISNIFPYDAYLKALSQIDTFLNKKGYLVIYNANYSFEDSVFYNKYVKIKQLGLYDGAQIDYGFVKRYKPNGSIDERTDFGTIFIKK